MTFVTRKVLDGQYDFDQNALVLEVEVTEKAADGTASHYSERRIYDITSLRIKTKADAAGLGGGEHEVLGARSAERMQELMPQIITTLKELGENASDLLKPKAKGTISPKKRLTLETAKVQDSAASLRAGSAVFQTIGKVSTSEHALDQAGDGTYQLGASGRTFFGEMHLNNTNVVQTLLKASSWEKMIKDVDGEAAVDPDHEWKSSHALCHTHEQLTEVLEAFTNNPLLDDACRHYHDTVAPQIGRYRQHVADLQREIQVNQGYLADSKYDVIRDSQNFRRLKQVILVDNQEMTRKIEHYNRLIKLAEDTLPVLHRDLATIFAIQNLQQQKLINMGKSPLGIRLSEQWDELVSCFDLNSSYVSLEDHLRKKLGLYIAANDGFSINLYRPSRDQLLAQCEEDLEEDPFETPDDVLRGGAPTPVFTDSSDSEFEATGVDSEGSPLLRRPPRSFVSMYPPASSGSDSELEAAELHRAAAPRPKRRRHKARELERSAASTPEFSGGEFVSLDFVERRRVSASASPAFARMTRSPTPTARPAPRVAQLSPDELEQRQKMLAKRAARAVKAKLHYAGRTVFDKAGEAATSLSTASGSEAEHVREAERRKVQADQLLKARLGQKRLRVENHDRNAVEQIKILIEAGLDEEEILRDAAFTKALYEQAAQEITA